MYRATHRKEIVDMKKWLLTALAVGIVACFALPAHAQWGSARTVKTEVMSDSLAVSVIDTSAVVDIGRLTDLSVFVQYDGDSAKVSIQHSIDGTYWTDLVTAAQMNGDPSKDPQIQYAKALSLLASGGSAYAYGFIGTHLRVIVNNDDKADPVENLKIKVLGRK